MRRFAAMSVLLVLGLTIAPYSFLASAEGHAQPRHLQEAAAPFVPGQLLIRFRPEVAA